MDKQPSELVGSVEATVDVDKPIAGILAETASFLIGMSAIPLNAGSGTHLPKKKPREGVVGK
jgi:hypothetical protein